MDCLYAEKERGAPAGEPQGDRRGPAWARRGGAFGPEPKKMLYTVAEFGAHGSYYTGWEKDCQNRGND
jgi:hypothetical protein